MSELSTATERTVPVGTDIMPLRRTATAGLLKITLERIKDFVLDGFSGGGGVPDGGSTGQVLTKLSDTDGDADWADSTGGGGGGGGGGSSSVGAHRFWLLNHMFSDGDVNAAAEIVLSYNGVPLVPSSVIANNSAYGAAANAIDGNNATIWASNGQNSWFLFDMGTPVQVDNVSITSRSDSGFGNQAPHTFDLLYANDQFSAYMQLVAVRFEHWGSGDTTVTKNLDLPTTVAGGSGVPDGGTTGQVLTKLSDTDGDADWADSTGGGGGGVQTPERRGVAFGSGGGDHSDVVLPLGVEAGDTAYCWVNSGNAPIAPTGWATVQSTGASAWNSALFAKVLSAADVLAGTISFYSSAGFSNNAVMIVYKGATGGVATVDPFINQQNDDISHFNGVTVTTGAIPANSDLLYGLSTRGNHTISSSTGASLASVTGNGSTNVWSPTAIDNAGTDLTYAIDGADYNINELRLTVLGIEAGAAPVVRGVGNATTGGTTLDIALPDGVAEGDHCVVLLSDGGDNYTIPTGWRYLRKKVADGWNMALVRGVITAGDITADKITFTCGAGYSFHGGAIFFEGAAGAVVDLDVETGPSYMLNNDWNGIPWTSREISPDCISVIGLTRRGGDLISQTAGDGILVGTNDGNGSQGMWYFEPPHTDKPGTADATFSIAGGNGEYSYFVVQFQVRGLA